MSRRIADWDGPGTGFVITGAVAYLDTLTLFCWRPLPDGVLASLRREYGRRLITETVEVEAELEFWFITIHQPKKKTLVALDAIKAKRFVINAVHIAVDFLCLNQHQASLATDYL